VQNKNRVTAFAAALIIVVGSVVGIAPLWASSSEKVLHSFNTNGKDGYFPFAGLIFDAAGNLYGTTEDGGEGFDGIVFELMPGTNGKWTEKVLHTFGANDKDGINPFAGLTFDTAGNLYGTTDEGGVYGYGVVFQLTPGANGKWTQKILHTFNSNGRDGIGPIGGLIFDGAGNLYGTTEGGGAYRYGVVFELTPHANGKWTEKVLHNFNANGKDGTFPHAGLIFDGAGNLYGTTDVGGAHASGTVFELTPAANGKWTEKILHSFNDNGADGIYPDGGVIFDSAGKLYGTTYEGGTRTSACSDFGSGCGTVFELTPGMNGKWTEKVLHRFNPDGKGGILPSPTLLFDSVGNLYGTTEAGGLDGVGCGGNGFRGCGTVFELMLGGNGEWTEKILHRFSLNGKDGIQPSAGLIFGDDGNLYGTTFRGGHDVSECGNSGCGAVFEVVP
jgi:uncharacterized repeat protein (TIGR03803 family)